MVDGDGAGSWTPPTCGACPPRRPRSGCARGLGPRIGSPRSARRASGSVRYATVSHDGRHAGRGGLGAVLGAKRLKAVAVRAATRCPVADPAAVLAAAKDLRARSFGPATAKYRDLGTLANLLAFNALSALPGPQLRQRTTTLALEDRAAVRDSCASCSIGCERIMTTKDGRSARVEYESAFALGPLVGIDDPDAVLEASARCDELGLDTISTGGTIAWAMEAGVADWLRFGDAGALLRAIELIGAREGIGDLLAEGSRRASAAVRPQDLAMHVKGLELPGYEPRTLHAMALGLAVNARGADHNRSGAYEADLSGELDRLDGGDAHVAAAIETEDRAAAMDSLILCKFLRGVFEDPWEEWAGAARARHRLGHRRRRAARHRARHRRRQARVQPPRGLDARRGHAAGAAARRPAHAPVRARGVAQPRAARRDGRRLPRTRGLDKFVRAYPAEPAMALSVPPKTDAPTVTCTIDGVEVTVPTGTTIYTAAKQAGIDIPVLCHDERYDPVGVCRMCVVDVGGRVLAAACVRPCEDGMEVTTATRRSRSSARC